MIKENDGATVAGDIAAVDDKIVKKPLRRDMKNEKPKKETKKVIEEGDGFNFYQSNDCNIFEITDSNAQEAYMTGYRRQQPQYWRQNAVTTTMLNHMNTEAGAGRNFTVKIGDNHSFPLRQQK